MRVLKVSDPLDAIEVARALLMNPTTARAGSSWLLETSPIEGASMVYAALGRGIAGFLDFQTLELFATVPGRARHWVRTTQ